MAIVVKDARDRSPYWYACYTSSDGRRLKKSTKETDERKAKLIADALQRAEELARNRELTETRTRELLSDVLARTGGHALRVFSVEEWFTRFVEQKKQSRSQATGKRHEQMMREFLAFLGPRARLNIAAISSRDIAAFREGRIALGLAPATVNVDVAILSSGFNAALRQGHITVNPCLAIERLRNKPQRKGVFSPEQVAALVESAQCDWRGLILLAFYSGQRLQDCANLKWRAIDLLSEIKIIRFAVRKTGGEIVTVIHPSLENYLLSLPAPESDDAFLFPSLAECRTGLLSKRFSELMTLANIERGLLRPRDKSGRSVSSLSFHSLRHSFTSLLANAGVPEEMRMALTGHKEREVHQRYTHRELQQLAEAIAVLPQV